MKKDYTCISLLIFIILTFTASSCIGQSDSLNYYKSVESYNNTKNKKALVFINKAIKENNTKSEYFTLKGEILYALNEDRDELFSYLSKAVATEPTSAFPLMIRAVYYEQIVQFQNAILDYNDAIKFAKEDSIIISIYINRGGLYTKIQKPEHAYIDLKKGYEIDSNNIGLLNNLAMCLDDLGKRPEANKTLLRIVEIDSTFFPAWVNLGFQATLKEEFELSLFYLNKADDLQPNQAYTLNNRGYAKFKLDDTKGALEDINKSIAILPSNSYAYRNKALIYLKTKEKDQACENLYLANKFGFALYYGDEVKELIKKTCIK